MNRIIPLLMLPLLLSPLAPPVWFYCVYVGSLK
jgi:hypothetical protein